MRYDELEDFQSDEITELHRLLLIQAFDGRPVALKKLSERPLEPLLVVAHENGQHHCDFLIKPQDFEMLLTDFEGFQRRIVQPIVRNLDGAAYPERMARLMPTYRRVAQLMVQQRA